MWMLAWKLCHAACLHGAPASGHAHTIGPCVLGFSPRLLDVNAL